MRGHVVVWTRLMLTMWTLVVVVNSLDDVEASTTSGEYVAQPDDENFRRMLVWARANPGGRQLEPAPPLPSSSVQLVGVDVRRVERKARVTDSETTDDDTSMTSTLSDEATSSDTRQLHLNRIRRKNFRLLTILKNINDRIGRGASPPPRMRDDVVQRVPRRNTSSSGCASVDECDDRPLTASSQTAVDHVHVVAQSCVRASAAASYEPMSGDDAGSGDGVWLEFSELKTSTDCQQSATGRDQLRRSKLVVYVRRNDTDNGDSKPATPRRLRRRQLKRSLRQKFGVSFESWHRHRRQRNRNVLLLSVYQEIIINRRRQRKKLKLIGKKRVRRSFTGGWLRVNVHPRMTSCPRGHRRRAGLQADQRLTLLLRVSDLDQSTVHQLVNTPVDCGSTSTLDTADRLETSAMNSGNVTSSSHQPYLQLSVSVPVTTTSHQPRRPRPQRDRSTAD